MWDAHKTYTPLSKRRADHLDRSGSLDCGIHCLDLMRYLIGGEQWAHISARGRWFGEMERKQAPHIAFMGDLDNGVLGTLNSSYAYCTNIPPKRKCFSLAVVGDRGCVNWASDGEQELALALITADGVETFAFEPMAHFTAIRLMMNDYAAFLAGERDWPEELATGRDGLIAQQAVDEALRQTHEQDARKTQTNRSLQSAAALRRSRSKRHHFAASRMTSDRSGWSRHERDHRRVGRRPGRLEWGASHAWAIPGTRSRAGAAREPATAGRNGLGGQEALAESESFAGVEALARVPAGVA